VKHKYTYRVESTWSYSAVSRKLYEHIYDVKIVDSADNFSDHFPLIIEIDNLLSSLVLMLVLSPVTLV